MNPTLDTIFSALSDPTRRAILARLAEGEAAVGDIAGRFEISAPAISRHLRVLEEAGLVSRRIEAQRRIIALDPEALRTASEWVDHYRRFWEESLDRLEAVLADDSTPNHSTSTKGPPHDHSRKPRR